MLFPEPLHQGTAEDIGPDEAGSNVKVTLLRKLENNLENDKFTTVLWALAGSSYHLRRASVIPQVLKTTCLYHQLLSHQLFFSLYNRSKTAIALW